MMQPRRRPVSSRAPAAGRTWTTSPAAVGSRRPSGVATTRRPSSSTPSATPRNGSRPGRLHLDLLTQGQAGLAVGGARRRSPAGRRRRPPSAGSGRRARAGTRAGRCRGRASRRRRAAATSRSARAARPRSWSTLRPNPTTAAAGPPSAPGTASARTPQTLRRSPCSGGRPRTGSGTRTSFGHLSPAGTPRPGCRASATATPVSSGSQTSAPRRPAGRSSTETARPARGGAVHARPSRPRPAAWCSATSTRPSAVAGPGARRPGRRSWTRSRATTSIARHAGSGPSVRARASAAGAAAGGPGRSTGSCRQCPPAATLAAMAEAAQLEPAPRPAAPDIHTTAGKLADLERRGDEARPRRVGAGGGEAARQGQEDRPRADRAAARRGLVRRARRVRPAPLDATSAWTSNRPYGDGVVTGYGTVDGRPVCVFSQDFTVFGGSPRRGVRREDRQGHGPRAEDRLPGRSASTRAAAPASRRASSPSACTARSSAATCTPPASIPQISLIMGPCAGGARLLPRAHRLHRHGRPDLAHVHHRPRRDQDGHRRGRQLRGARRRPHAQHQVRQRALPGRPTRTTRSTTSRRCCPTCRATTSTTRRSSTREADGPARSPTTTASSTR